jgi:hypothetical protein
VPDSELMAKEIDSFVITNLIKAQLQREGLSEKLQRRLAQAGENSSAREEHPARLLFCTALYRGADLTELLIRQPLGVIQDEERGIGLGRVRYRYCPATGGQHRHDRAGAGHLLAREFRPARDADHPVMRPSQLAESPSERLRVRRRITGDENKAALAAYGCEDPAGNGQVVRLARKITGSRLDRSGPVSGVRCGGRHRYAALPK